MSLWQDHPRTLAAPVSTGLPRTALEPRQIDGHRSLNGAAYLNWDHGTPIVVFTRGWSNAPATTSTAPAGGALRQQAAALHHNMGAASPAPDWAILARGAAVRGTLAHDTPRPGCTAPLV